MSNARKTRKLTALALLALAALPAAAGAQTCNDYIPRTAPDSRFVDNADGTVTDLGAGLIWKRCSEGQVYDAVSGGCEGTGAFLTWQQALQRVEAVNTGAAGESTGRTDWRLPNIKELASLVEYACSPSINESAFPDALSSYYWTATHYAATNYAWVVLFGGGGVAARPKSEYSYVRLVRGGD